MTEEEDIGPKGVLLIVFGVGMAWSFTLRSLGADMEAPNLIFWSGVLAIFPIVGFWGQRQWISDGLAFTTLAATFGISFLYILSNGYIDMDGVGVQTENLLKVSFYSAMYAMSIGVSIMTVWNILTAINQSRLQRRYLEAEQLRQQRERERQERWPELQKRWAIEEENWQRAQERKRQQQGTSGSPKAPENSRSSKPAPLGEFDFDEKAFEAVKSNNVVGVKFSAKPKGHPNDNELWSVVNSPSASNEARLEAMKKITRRENDRKRRRAKKDKPPEKDK